MPLVKMLTVVMLALLAAGVFGYSRLPEIASLKTENPKTTALIELRSEDYRKMALNPLRHQIWVPYDAIAENLKRAVILSEDGLFFSHKGINFIELKEAIKIDLESREFKRGGSTITMQLTRNLYLTPGKSPLRKLQEMLLAIHMERHLSKRRILELYLNVVEWGRGIYGVEAASQHYLSKPSANLTVLEGATLAALLPDPIDPSDDALRARRNRILGRMLRAGYLTEEEFRRAKAAALWRK